jgi:hypothetical protein
MTFPTGTQIPTTNLASGSSDPSLARADLYDLVVAVNAIIASYNAAQGVLVLNGSAKVATSYLPSTIAVTGDIALQPSTGIVSVQNALRLAQTVTADLGTQTGTTSPTAGDLVYLTDGDAGRPCLGCYDGTKWRIVRFATQVGDVGATLTAAATLTGEAD